MTLAVSARIGTVPAGAGSSRIRRVASSPSMTGIWMSISTTSGGSCATCATAAAPSAAKRTWWPCRLRISPRSSRLAATSSATSTASGRIGAGAKPVLPAAATASPRSSGSSNQNRLPRPGVLSSPIVPPIAATSDLQITNPSPVPP